MAQKRFQPLLERAGTAVKYEDRAGQKVTSLIRSKLETR